MKTLLSIHIVLFAIYAGILAESRYEAVQFKPGAEEVRNRLHSHKAIMFGNPEIEILNLKLKKMHALAEDPIFSWVTSSKWLEIKPIDYTTP